MDVLDQCQTVVIQLPSQSIVYEWLFQIHHFYRPIHTYVSIMLCLVGTLCNFCNIVVLTRKQMRTPVNMILTAMACCDTVVLFSNLIYTTHYTFVAFANCHPKHWSYGWAMFLIAHAHLSLVGHSSSVWLSVMLAFIRYLTLRRRGKMTGIQIDLKHSYVAIAAVVVFVSVMNAPNFLTYKIMEMGLNETCVITDESVRFASAYVPGVSDMAVEADCLVFRMAFWISGTVFKVLPCVLLTLLVSLLTQILNEVKANRQRLLHGATACHTAFAPTDISAVSNTASSTGGTSTVTNLNAVAPAAQAPPPSVAFNNGRAHAGYATATKDGSTRRHSSYDALPPPSPQLVSQLPLISLSDRHSIAEKTAIKSPPISTKGTTPPNNRYLANNEHFSLTRSNSAKANIGCLTSRPVTSGGGGGGNSGGARADRTTRMLLAIVCVFLITEFPQGIMALLSGFFSEEFRRYIYNNVGDILDLLSLCEACTSFIIYCSMSGQFRNEFRRVFVPIRLRHWLVENSYYVQRSNCHRCSDTYLNQSRSGVSAVDGCDAAATIAVATSTVSSPFLRPTSRFSGHSNGDDDSSSVGLMSKKGIKTRASSLAAEQKERRFVTINLMDGGHKYYLDRHSDAGFRSASPSLAIVDEGDADDTVLQCNTNFIERNARQNTNNADKTGNQYTGTNDKISGKNYDNCVNKDSTNNGKFANVSSNYGNEVYKLNSPTSPDIPLILCSDWSNNASGENSMEDVKNTIIINVAAQHVTPADRHINCSNCINTNTPAETSSTSAEDTTQSTTINPLSFMKNIVTQQMASLPKRSNTVPVRAAHATTNFRNSERQKHSKQREKENKSAYNEDAESSSSNGDKEYCNSANNYCRLINYDNENSTEEELEEDSRNLLLKVSSSDEDNEKSNRPHYDSDETNYGKSSEKSRLYHQYNNGSPQMFIPQNHTAKMKMSVSEI